MQARGTTLVELAISLAIVAIAVLSVALTFPIGVRAQQTARFRLYAAAKALELVDTFANAEHHFISTQVEAAKLATNTFMAHPVDFEHMMNAGGFGLFPLPPALARRLDSDDGEIAAILDEGGMVFYATPEPHRTGFESRDAAKTGGSTIAGLTAGPARLAPEAQKLIFGVSGYAQQNALPNHPCLAWPYNDFHPSPAQPWERETWASAVRGAGHPTAWPALAAFDAVYAIANSENFHGLYRDGEKIDA
ncbi:MAG: type II secretion system protein, partial [Planctomycetes bacterium]|nr:type II secretion system protein [Planctomycetota bacterium]